MLNQKTQNNKEYAEVLTVGVSPVSVLDLASYLTVGESTDLQGYIDNAIEVLENRHGIAIYQKTYKYTADYHQASRGYVGFYYVPAIRADFITLPTANADTVTSVKENGTAVDFTNQGNKVLTTATCNIEILYSAGYTASTLPADIKMAVLKLAGYTYDNRGKCQDGISSDIVTAAGASLKKYEVYL
jgi:uncharacterized phiE125 gp8 family phage protein